MKKIISLFMRNYDDGQRLVRDEIVPGAEWVVRGEGEATVKLDGTGCLSAGLKLWKRYDRKLTKQAHRKKKKGFTGPWTLEDYKAAPEGWVEAEAAADSLSGHWPGWLPVGDGPEDQWHREALANRQGTLPPGTYELCGPKIRTNAEHCGHHELFRHGCFVLANAPRTYTALLCYFRDVVTDIEGIVWHHPDGRMVKIKAGDFGLTRRPAEEAKA